MDAKSAARGTERVEREIEALSEMREKFNEFCESYDARSAGEEDREGEGRKLINTRVGIMEYRLMPDSSSYDLSEPRLLRPNGPIGDLYAKMESLFKDKIAPRLGIVIQPQPQLLTDSYGGPDGRLLVYRFV
jgi:hypothetical protein